MPGSAMDVLLEVFAAEVEGHPDDHSGEHYPTTPQGKTDGQESHREGECAYEEPPSFGQDARLSSLRKRSADTYRVSVLGGHRRREGNVVCPRLGPSRADEDGAPSVLQGDRQDIGRVGLRDPGDLR